MIIHHFTIYAIYVYEKFSLASVLCGEATSYRATFNRAYKWKLNNRENTYHKHSEPIDSYWQELFAKTKQNSSYYFKLSYTESVECLCVRTRGRLTARPVKCRLVKCRRLTVARLSVARYSVAKATLHEKEGVYEVSALTMAYVLGGPKVVIRFYKVV